MPDLAMGDPGRNGLVARMVERLREAVAEAGGNQAVMRRSGIPSRTLSHYLAGREMRASTLVALADACGVSAEWLATGRGEKPAASPGPKTFEQGVLPAGGAVATGSALPIVAAAEPSRQLRPPAAGAPDPVILSKAIEVVDALVKTEGTATDPLDRARKIARAYEILAASDTDLPELPFHVSRSEG